MFSVQVKFKDGTSTTISDVKEIHYGFGVGPSGKTRIAFECKKDGVVYDIDEIAEFEAIANEIHVNIANATTLGWKESMRATYLTPKDVSSPIPKGKKE